MTVELSKACYSSPRISSEYQDCSLPITFDQFNRCSYECQYCFSTYQKSNNPSTKENWDDRSQWVLKAVNIDKLIKAFTQEDVKDKYGRRFFSKRFPFHIGGLADPFDSYEAKFGVMYELLKATVTIKYPVIFSSKGILPSKGKWYDLFKESAPNKNFAFQASIITGSEELAKTIETGAPTVKARLENLKAMSDLGYWTILRLRPFIIGISDVELDNLLSGAKEAGIRAVSMEFFCLDGRANELMFTMYQNISEACGFDIYQYYKALSPSARGNYYRLNREVKEYYVKKVYTFCKENGIQFNISDPDYKELNESSSCCGLPDTKDKYDSELTNFNRGQLTHMIRKARIDYWKTGEGVVTWGDMVDASFDGGEWLQEKGYYNDSIQIIGKNTAELKFMNFQYEFMQAWNNVNSPKNPYKYFYGKLEPFAIDKDDMLMFKYVPSDYEYVWRAEGLL